MLRLSSEERILVGTLGASLISTISVLLSVWLTKRYEERRNKRELFINAAVKNWEKGCDIALAQKGIRAIYPLEDFIISMLKLSELLDKEMTPKNIESKLQEIKEILNALAKQHSTNARKNPLETCPT